MIAEQLTPVSANGGLRANGVWNVIFVEPDWGQCKPASY